MTIKQKLVIFAGLAAIALMLLLPPTRVMEPSNDSSGVSIHTVIRYQLLVTKSINKIHYYRLMQQCLIALAATLGLHSLCGRAEKSAKNRARILAAIRRELQDEIADREHIENSLRQQNTELLALNEQLQSEIKEQKKVAGKLQEFQEEIAQALGQKMAPPTKLREEATPENPEDQKPKSPEKPAVKPSDTTKDSADPRFDLARERMVAEIENLNEMIKDGEL